MNEVQSSLTLADKVDRFTEKFRKAVEFLAIIEKSSGVVQVSFRRSGYVNSEDSKTIVSKFTCRYPYHENPVLISDPCLTMEEALSNLKENTKNFVDAVKKDYTGELLKALKG